MAALSIQPSFDLHDFPLVKECFYEQEHATRTQILSENATFNFILTSVYKKTYNRLLRIEHSLGDGFYFEDDTCKITQEICDELTNKLNELLRGPIPIELGNMDRTDLLSFYRKLGLDDKIDILKTWQDKMIPVIQCGDFTDYVLEPMSTNKERLLTFELRPYEGGLLCRLPTMMNPNGLNEFKDPKVLHEMFHEYSQWAKLLHIKTVGQLNHAIYTGAIKNIKLVAEGLHERKLAKIAETLCQNYENKRVVTIAGPSSSNKTTFAKRLEIQLNVNGYKAVIIEMDDYFQDTHLVPYGDDGIQDLEHISALNVALLGERVHQLLDGDEIPRRKFVFKDSIGVDSETERLKLGPKTFLILEGIHGLNPELLQAIGREGTTPIYVSALTPLNIDYNHRFPTSDNRLIRRIIRDNQFRGQNPRMTIRRWTSVRVGEEKNIFPYQGNAELFFNSSLVYELPVMSIYGRVLLSEATIPPRDEDPDSPESKDVTDEATRLLNLFKCFYPLSPENVPAISCIREFIGSSELKY